jgi:hypothetical protein
MTRCLTHTHARPARTIELDAIVLRQLRAWRDIGDVWTGDVARAVGEPTGKVYEALERLADAGKIVRVSKGNPSSWIYSS